MKPEDQIAADRGHRAKSALDDFLSPAFDVVIADYTRRVMQIAAETPWETVKIAKLSAAVKIAEAVRAQIVDVVAHGEAASAEIKRARAIEALPTERRKILGI